MKEIKEILVNNDTIKYGIKKENNDDYLYLNVNDIEEKIAYYNEYLLNEKYVLLNQYVPSKLFLGQIVTELNDLFSSKISNIEFLETKFNIYKLCDIDVFSVYIADFNTFTIIVNNKTNDIVIRLRDSIVISENIFFIIKEKNNIFSVMYGNIIETISLNEK